MKEAHLDLSTGMGLLFGFSVLWVALGWYLGRDNKTKEDFQLAGRNVGFALGTATAMATWVTANTTLVAPELAYQMGIWGMVGYSLGSVGLLLFAPLAKKIREILPFATTSGDFFRIRYGNSAWRLFLIVSLVYSLGWLVSLGMAGGILVQSLTGIPYEIGLTVILGICVAYTMLGGLKAVIGTDFLQTVIILIGLVLLGALAYQKVPSGVIHSTLQHSRPELLNLLFPAALVFLFNNILFGIGEIFHSNVWWSRAFAFRKGVGFRAFFWSGLLWIPVPIAAGFLAFVAPARGLAVPYPDMVGPLVAGELLGEWGAVLVFVLVFSALSSSLDSLLAATSDLVVEDIYKGHIRPLASDAEISRANLYTIALLGFVAWLVCLPRISNLAMVLHFSGALVAATIWPIVLGIFWERSNRLGAFWAMLGGSILGLGSYFHFGFYTSATVGCVVSFSIVTCVSFIFPEKFSWEEMNP